MAMEILNILIVEQAMYCMILTGFLQFKRN